MFDKKKLIFLPHCHSTNEHLQSLCSKDKIDEGHLVWTDFQESGKGQRGSFWESEPGKNLLFSFLIRPKFLEANNQSLLNLVVSLALTDTIKGLGLAGYKIKWPNDIYLNENKIAGILIESSIMGNQIEQTIIGVGFNINQQIFNTDNCTSLIQHIDQTQDRKIILDRVLDSFLKRYESLQRLGPELILKNYHQQLLWINEPHHFLASNQLFDGIIRGINPIGQLIVETKKQLKTFNVKEIAFVD